MSKGSGSGLMFRSSSSKRTAILVISISSSGFNMSDKSSLQTQLDPLPKMLYRNGLTQETWL